MLVAVKDFPELGVTSAFQKVTLVRGRFVSNSNSKEDMEAAIGRLNFAPKAPHQPLFPERRASQFPLTPGEGKKVVT